MITMSDTHSEMSNDDEHLNDDGGDEDERDDGDEDDDDEDDPLEKIKAEVSNMSFEELLLLKEKLGTKAYNAALFPSSKKSTGDNTKKLFTRENKNRPTEVSSKKRIPEIRSVVAVKKKVVRDPRFDDLSGNYNETYFNQAYGFMSDVKQREKKKLVKSLKHEKDLTKRAKIERLLKTMTQKEKAEKDRDEKKKKEKELRAKERELVAKGKKPYFMKKSEKRKLETEAKQAELQASGQLDKYLKKQSKKTLAKERKNIVPFL